MSNSDSELDVKIEKWAQDICSTQAIASLVQRLIELEDVSFDEDGNLSWTSCGDLVDEVENEG
jgi:hypothetical protein